MRLKNRDEAPDRGPWFKERRPVLPSKRHQRFGIAASVLALVVLLGGCAQENPPRKAAAPPTSRDTLKTSADRPGASPRSQATSPPSAESPAPSLEKEMREEGEMGPIPAIEAAAADEDAAKVLRRAARAIHLTEAARRKVIVGQAVSTGPNGDFEIDLSSAPDGRLWFRQKYPGVAPYVAMFTGTESFTVEKDGQRHLLGSRDYLMVRSHDFQRICFQPGVFANSLTRVNKETYHGQVCVKLQGLARDNTPVDFFYREEDGRPVGFRLLNDLSPDQRVEIYYRDWMDVGGVDLPSVIVASDEQGEFVFQFHTLYFEDLLPPEDETSLKR